MKTQNENELKTVREQIDKIDTGLIEAISERAKLAEKVLKAKADSMIFRPGREADIINDLINKADIPPKMVEKIWRLIIAQNIAAQGRLTIAMMDNPEMLSAAQMRFPDAFDAIIEENITGVFSAVASKKAQLGIVPHWQSDPSWTAIIAQFDGHYIAGVTSMMEHKGEPQAAIIASALPDPSQKDITLLFKDGKIIEVQGRHENDQSIIGIIQALH